MPESVDQRLCDLSLVDVATKIQNREVSPVEVTEAVLARIATLDAQLNAFVTILPDQARQQAQQAETKIADGEYRGPLHGIPVSIKDLFATAGVRTTAGSRILADNVPNETATVVARLAEAGAILVGKTNMLEFAYGAVYAECGAARNPWDLIRTTSGSSSGSAAAVAAGMGYGSLGSDTGGSIRLPASYCGIVGLKPTYGRISRHGAVPVSWSADHVGPMTRTVADAAVLLGVIAGPDPRDPTSASIAVPDYLEHLDGGMAGRRVGIADAYLRERVDGEVQNLVEAAISQLAAAGATIEEVTLPVPTEAVPALLAILLPEMTAYHLPILRQHPEDYSQTLRERLELGAITPAVSYIQAQGIRRQITDAMLAVMNVVDFLAMPTTPTAATLLEADLTMGNEADPELLTALINFTGPFDLTGFPAISVPCGFTSNGLPVGLQLVGRPFEEAALLAVGHAYEQLSGWYTQRPPIVANL